MIGGLPVRNNGKTKGMYFINDLVYQKKRKVMLIEEDHGRGPNDRNLTTIVFLTGPILC